MWLFIRPLDTVCCRDGRPFTAGEGVMAKTMFPPLPSTFYGAVRSAILAENGKAFNDFHKQKQSYPDLPEVGTPGQFGSLDIAGPCLSEKNEKLNRFQMYFPAPAHFVEEKENKDKYHKLLPDDRNTEAEAVSDLKIPVQLTDSPKGEVVKRFEGFLNYNGAQKLLVGGKQIPEKKDTFKSDELFSALWQVGLKRIFEARTAEEGQLYSVGHHQMVKSQSLGFYLKIEGVTKELKSGMLKLGGEWRAAVYEVSEQAPFQDMLLNDITELIYKNKRFFLWLITPAVFTKGYLPGGFDTTSLEGSVKGVLVKLRSCQTISKKYIGGFKLGKGGSGGSKTGYYAVPSGSVYFFELKNEMDKGVISDLVRKQMFGTMEGQLNDMAKQGFGTTLIGGY